MTELLISQPRSDERRDCVVTGMHLQLAMIAAGVEHNMLPHVARIGGVFESTIIESRSVLRDAKHVEFDGRYEDALTAEGEAFVLQPSNDMLYAHAVVQSAIGK